MIYRRAFLQQFSLAIAALAITPSLIFANDNSRILGLQLYSLRDTIADDLDLTIEKIAGIGFKEVETYGYSQENGLWGRDIAQFKKLLDDNGLKSPSGHYGLDSYFAEGGGNDDFKYVLDAAAGLGQQYIVIPSLDKKLCSSIDDYKRLADKMNAAGALCAKTGIKLGYHNHDFEFTDYDGANGYETLLSNTDEDLVVFEMDIFWVVRAGRDPLSLLKKYPGRFALLHIKDMDKLDKELNTEIGSGTIDFVELSKVFNKAGAKHLILEQENFEMNAYKSLSESYAYMEKNLIKS